MFIENRPDEYRVFLSQNEAFWRENTRKSNISDDRLYVDLSHDHPAYLATNLWVAKLVQKVLGGRLIGLAHGWLRACPQYNLDRVGEMARSFLVEEVIDLDSAACDDADTTRRFEATVRGLFGARLRNGVLSFDAHQDPDLGWILYDTYLRQERRGTLEIAGPELFECARTVFRMRRAVAAVMAKGKIAGAIVGHHHYSPYAFMAFEAVRRGAPVYFQSLLVPVSIRRFITESDVRRGRPADFLSEYDQQIVARSDNERLASFERRIFDIQRGAREFFKAGHELPAGGDRKAMLASWGLNAELPVVCFYVPALCGAPHCFGPIAFDDFGDWLRRSLDVAVRTPQINFLVKRHPQNAVYDTSNLVGDLQSVYASAPNVRFLNVDITSSELAGVCDLVATVNGTAGYEMAVRGVPTVAAGPGRYSDLGFAMEPSDFAEYAAILAGASGHTLSAQQRRRALIFAFFELGMGRSVSLFLPPPRAVDSGEFWQQAERNLHSRFLEEDPLYRNIRHMLEANLPFLLNTDVGFQNC